MKSSVAPAWPLLTVRNFLDPTNGLCPCLTVDFVPTIRGALGMIRESFAMFRVIKTLLCRVARPAHEEDLICTGRQRKLLGME